MRWGWLLAAAMLSAASIAQAEPNTKVIEPPRQAAPKQVTGDPAKKAAIPAPQTAMPSATRSRAQTPLTKPHVATKVAPAFKLDCKVDKMEERNICSLSLAIQERAQMLFGALTINPKGDVVSLAATPPLITRVRVDKGEVINMPCQGYFCTMAAGDAERFVRDLRAGKRLLVDMKTLRGGLPDPIAVDLTSFNELYEKMLVESTK